MARRPGSAQARRCRAAPDLDSWPFVRVAELVADGRAASASDVANLKLKITGNDFAVDAPEGPQQGTLKFDGSTNPKSLDVTTLSGGVTYYYIAQVNNSAGTASGKWSDWTAEDIRGLVHWSIDVFGAERCMVGGDWPVSVLAGGYGKAFAAYKAVLDDRSTGEQTQICHQTAMAFYGVALPAGETDHA